MKRLDTITLRRVVPEVFPETPASGVWGCDITFHRGETYLVKAASGTGKSSLCSFIYGSRRFPEYRGEILFNGENIAGFRHSRFSSLRRTELAYLPQEMMIFGELTAMENILLKNRLTNAKSVKEIREMLEILGIAELENRPAATLSIGQQQRVAIIRTLCQPFSFILLDEPVSHLDSANNSTAALLIHGEAVRQGAGIITTSVGADLSLPKPFTLVSL